MVMPLHDNIKLKRIRFAVVNWLIILVNVGVFIAVFSESFGDPLTVIRGFGFVPAVFFGKAQLAKWIVTPPWAWMTLFTSLFFHSSLPHLLGNMLFLYVFGDNVEDAMGSFRYLVFYLLCGVAGTFVFAFMAPSLTVSPLIGASGAISGVCAAFMLFYPRATVFGLAAMIVPIHAPALWFVGTWIVLQFLSALFVEHGQVGWWAHVGGIGAGLLLAPLFKRRDTPPVRDASPRIEELPDG